tara:strand:- start:226 stop:867 length:642 start_codon:yes stop_codon:yes gene_type:complete
MFELNNKLEVKKQQIKNSIIYTIDNFYRQPDKILNFIERNPAQPHKIEEQGSLNMKHFQDLRHSNYFKDLEEVNIFLKNLVKQDIKYSDYNFSTNVTKFIDKNFNDYKNNYWYPHKDFGYTALVYFNKDEIDGTNLYEDLDNDFESIKKTSEHSKPWRPREKWQVIHTIKAKYNRCVIFDGLIFHGMAVNNDTFFNKYRVNQVLFFKKNIDLL